MNERIKELAEQAEKLADKETKAFTDDTGHWRVIWNEVYDKKFAELIQEDMYRKVIASILITDVVMEEKGQTPTSEDYILAINKDFGVEE